MDEFKQKERVMVVKAKSLRGVNGIEFKYHPFIDIIKKESVFIDRETAESDYSNKQVIPYGIIFFRNMLFAYQRTVEVTEKRLAKLLSIGIGGHINSSDAKDPIACIEEAMQRELNEELYLAEYNKKIVAVINDDSDDVGKVHFGIVFRICLLTPSVKLKDSSLSNFAAIDLSKPILNFDEYENWSKLCLVNIHRIKGC